MMFGRLSAQEEAKSREKSALDRRIMTEVKGVKTGLPEAVRAALRSDPQLQWEEAELFAAAQRILSKMEAMNHEYLKWWEVMLALFGGWVGYSAPIGVRTTSYNVCYTKLLRHYMADVRHHYHRHEMVEEAVYDATETAPYEMALHGQSYNFV